MAQSIADIKNELNSCEFSNLPQFISKYATDERSGVKSLVAKAEKRIRDYENELRRIEAMREFEHRFEDRFEFICGVDEAGRGPFAGPIVAGAAILPKDVNILYLNDSKKLSEQKREELFLEIKDKAISFGVGIVSAERIDEIGVGKADFEAMRLAIQKLSPQPDFALTDAFLIPELWIPQENIIKGDARSVSIAAASILAKVTRDHIMMELDKKYPMYGFKEHKGYGTQAHRDAIIKYGVCPEHRMSFLKNMQDLI